MSSASLTTQQTQDILNSLQPTPEKSRSALFNFSIDLELCWGNGNLGGYDHSVDRRFKAAQSQADSFQVFIELLDELDFPLSWAVVGILAQQDLHCSEDSGEDTFKPKWSKGDWYKVPNEIEKHSDFFDGRKLLDQISTLKTKQEILSHGYAHIDFSDDAANREVADSDLLWSKQALKPWNENITGFAYPCNNVGHVDLLSKNGFKVFRGQTNNWKFHTRLIETPVGFWLSPGRLNWKDLKKIIDAGVEGRCYIHPWMHLIECDLKQKDIENFYRPMLTYVKELESAGKIKNISYSGIDELFNTSET